MYHVHGDPGDLSMSVSERFDDLATDLGYDVSHTVVNLCRKRLVSNHLGRGHRVRQAHSNQTHSLCAPRGGLTSVPRILGFRAGYVLLHIILRLKLAGRDQGVRHVRHGEMHTASFYAGNVLPHSTLRAVTLKFGCCSCLLLSATPIPTSSEAALALSLVSMVCSASEKEILVASVDAGEPLLPPVYPQMCCGALHGDREAKGRNEKHEQRNL